MSLKENLRHLGKGFRGIARETVEAGRRLLKKSKETAYHVTGKIERGIKSDGVRGAMKKGRDAKNYARDAYKDFKDEFFPDGKFNSERADKALENIVDATKKWGRKTVSRLREIVAETSKDVKADFREHIPTPEELSTKYNGIGTSYSGILLRKDYERCLAFYNQISESINGNPKYKTILLEDIKANAIDSKDELLQLYAARGDKVMYKRVGGIK